MDFIEAQPNSKGKQVILVVVHQLTKYEHFIGISHPYSVEQIVQVFIDNNFRLHGLPLEIVSDHDRIFTSNISIDIYYTEDQTEVHHVISPPNGWMDRLNA